MWTVLSVRNMAAQTPLRVLLPTRRIGRRRRARAGLHDRTGPLLTLWYSSSALCFVDLLKNSGAFTPEESSEYLKVRTFRDLPFRSFCSHLTLSTLQLGALNGLFVLGRSIGFIGHFIDQKRLKQPLYRHPADDIFIQPFDTTRVLVKERQ